MPNVIGVRVYSYGAYSPPTVRVHTDGRCFSYADAGNLRIHAAGRPDPIAVYQPAAWDLAELVYGEVIDAHISHLTAEKVRDAVAQPWPYDPTSGTVSTDDAVEQAKHEAADHIDKARIEAAEKLVKDAQEAQAFAMRRHAEAIADAQKHLAWVRAELADEQGDAA